MQIVGQLFPLIYLCVVVGLGIFVLTLLIRLVKAQERIAKALEESTRNLGGEDQ